MKKLDKVSKKKYSKRKIQAKTERINLNISDRIQLLSLPNKHLVEAVLVEHSHVLNKVWQDRLRNLLSVIIEIKCEKLNDKLDMIKGLHERLRPISDEKSSEDSVTKLYQSNSITTQQSQEDSEEAQTSMNLTYSKSSVMFTGVQEIGPDFIKPAITPVPNSTANLPKSIPNLPNSTSNLAIKQTKSCAKRSKIPRFGRQKTTSFVEKGTVKNMLATEIMALDMKSKELQKTIESKEQELEHLNFQKLQLNMEVAGDKGTKRNEQSKEPINIQSATPPLKPEENTNETKEKKAKSESVLLNSTHYKDVDEFDIENAFSQVIFNKENVIPPITAARVEIEEVKSDCAKSDTNLSMVCNNSSPNLNFSAYPSSVVLPSTPPTMSRTTPTDNGDKDIVNKLELLLKALYENQNKPKEDGDMKKPKDLESLKKFLLQHRREKILLRQQKEQSAPPKKQVPVEEKTKAVEKPKEKEEEQQPKKRVINVPSVAVRAYIALIMDMQRNCKLYKSFRKELIKPADLYKEPYVDAAYACWMAYMEYSITLLDYLHPYIINLVRVHYTCKPGDSELEDYETKIPTVLISGLKNMKPWKMALTECMNYCMMFDDFYIKPVPHHRRFRHTFTRTPKFFPERKI